ncbi:MAG: pilus assembly protein [Acidobacteria bacterium]|nr:pilus assembly protein [Acidobacteriota bacterium]
MKQHPSSTIQQGRNPRGGKRDGVAMVEFGMTSVVVFLMLLVTFDFGIYTSSFLAIQNASRVAALRNSGGLESADDQATACSLAIEQMRGLPGIDASFTSDCSSGLVVVTSELCDADSPCAEGAGGFDSDPSVKVVVRYTLPDLFHLPNVGPGVIARATHAKVRAIS